MFRWLKRKKHEQRPDWLENYLGLDFRINKQTQLDDQIFVGLDTETTGLEKSDDIITIGAIQCTTKEVFLNNILDQKFSGIKAGKSSEIHGELEIQEGKDGINYLQELISFISNHIIIGHNISFDIMMINQLLQSQFNIQLKNKVIDTAILAIRLDPVKYERSIGGKSQLHLDDLCNEYDLKIENRHTALGDAYLTVLLFQRLVSKLKKRGIHSLKDLLRT